MKKRRKGMELKQLEFFLACAEYGSLGKAAEKLYTSQPNVSRVIRSLEEELKSPLFERTSRGLQMTAYGRDVHRYAVAVIKNTDIIKGLRPYQKEDVFSVSTYSSNVMAKLLTELYLKYPDMKIEHRCGNIEEIIEHVRHGISEIGILYISRKNKTAFYGLLNRNQLRFEPLGERRACIYGGEKSPVYHRDRIWMEELKNLKFVREYSDFFSIEKGLGAVGSEEWCPEFPDTPVYTDSEHLSGNMLQKTDVVTLGIDLGHPEDMPGKIKKVFIEDDSSVLSLGYVARKDHSPTKYAEEFIAKIRQDINRE